jgi:hypothetical protein
LGGRSARRNATTYTQNKTKAEKTHTDIHASSGIRNQGPSVKAGEDGSYLKNHAVTVIGRSCNYHYKAAP